MRQGLTEVIEGHLKAAKADDGLIRRGFEVAGGAGGFRARPDGRRQGEARLSASEDSRIARSKTVRDWSRAVLKAAQVSALNCISRASSFEASAFIRWTAASTSARPFAASPAPAAWIRSAASRQAFSWRRRRSGRLPAPLRSSYRSGQYRLLRRLRSQPTRFLAGASPGPRRSRRSCLACPCRS